MPKKPKPKAKPKRHRNVKIVSTTKAGPSLERLGVGGRESEEIKEGMVALARGTDALVQRVVSSAREGSRDPAEHVLDLSKAYYSEESGERIRGDGHQHSVQCDRCMLKSPGASSLQRAVQIAEAVGWVVGKDFDHCPACKDGSKLLKGSSVALVVPPKLSHSDMILVVRLRYIAGYIERGASVPAFLQNSVRSQHRPMLSDLAQGMLYDPEELVVHIDSLVARNADVSGVFVEGKAREFLTELFQALKAEDQPE
jgi:hypothetical protein